MPWTNIADWLFQRSPQQQQVRAYWRTVPLRRLTNLLLAIFCLFGMIGCFVDLLTLGEKPLVTVLVWTVFTGVLAVGYLLALSRAPRYFFVVLAIHLLGSLIISIGIRKFGSALQRPAIEEGVTIATIACIALSMAAFIFFLQFIQNEGRHAVRIQTELSLAQGIQQTLVPTIEWRSRRAEIYGVSLPSTEVGGDLVDVVSLPDGSVFAYVADVSGHGLPAGILMGMIKTAVRTQLFDLPSPTAVFERLNEVLPAVNEPHMYSTCTALRIFDHAGDQGCRLEYAIAGQPPILHASARAKTIVALADQQLPLGLLAGPPYQGHTMMLYPGDTLLVATDGILEAATKDGTEFGLASVQSLLADNLSLPLPSIAEKVHAALSASYIQTDDQSLLLVRLFS
jgi:serine phosphatase RsbU (regulator of sigma subunit)